MGTTLRTPWLKVMVRWPKVRPVTLRLEVLELVLVPVPSKALLITRRHRGTRVVVATSEGPAAVLWGANPLTVRTLLALVIIAAIR